MAARLLLAASICAALVLSGCAAAVPDAQQSTVPAPTEEDSGASASGEAERDDAQPADAATAAEGAYVEYVDGIIAETEGDKALFFHAPWCPQCRALEQSIRDGSIPAGLTIIKVDFDTETALRQQYGVTLQTTIVYVDDDGNELSSAVLYEDTTLDALVAAGP